MGVHQSCILDICKGVDHESSLNFLCYSISCLDANFGLLIAASLSQPMLKYSVAANKLASQAEVLKEVGVKSKVKCSVDFDKETFII